MNLNEIEKLVDEYFNSNPTTLKLSREQVREILTSKLYEVFQLLNYKYDTSNSSFSQLLINLFSAIVGDTLSFSNFLYGESTLVTAQLYESVYNWARMLDYNPNFASPAITTVQLTFPYEQAFTYELIPFQVFFKSKNGILFTPVNKVEITRVFNDEINEPVSIYQYVIADGYEQKQPVKFMLSVLNNRKVIVFNIPVINLYTSEYTIISDNYTSYIPYEHTFNLSGNEYLYDIKVFVNGEQFTRGNLEIATSMDKVFDIVFIDQNSFTLKFGNNVMGKGIDPGSEINVTLYITNGKSGNIDKFSINETLDVNSTYGIIEYTALNVEKGSGGINSPTLDEIKYNTIVDLRTNERIVTLQDFVDFANRYKFVDNFVILQKESDTRTNDIYMYVVLTDDSNNVVPTDTISIDYEQLRLNLSSQLVEQGQIQVINWNNQLVRFEFNPVYTDNTTFVVPGYLFIDLNKSTWFLIPSDEILLDYQLVSFTNDDILSQIDITSYLSITSDNQYKFKFVFEYSDNYSQVIESFLESSNKTLVVTNSDQVLRYDLSSELYSKNQNYKVYVLEFEVPVKYISLFGTRSSVYMEITNEITGKIEYEILLPFTNLFYDYGPIVSSNSKLLLVDIPVVNSQYQNIQYVMTQFKNLSDNFLNTTTNRMLNFKPHIRFIRTTDYVRDVHYSSGDYSVVSLITCSDNNQTVTVNNQTIQLPCTFDIRNPTDIQIIRNYTANLQPGYYAFQSSGGVGSYIYNSIFDKFIEVPNSTFINIQDTNTLYVTVDNMFHKVMIQNPLQIKIVVNTTANSTYSIISEKIKDIVVNYINSKQPNENIYFSELVTLIQSIPNITNVRIVEPKYDIIFNYDINNLSKNDFLTYVPEYVYVTKDNIEVQFE